MSKPDLLKQSQDLMSSLLERREKYLETMTPSEYRAADINAWITVQALKGLISDLQQAEKNTVRQHDWANRWGTYCASCGETYVQLKNTGTLDRCIGRPSYRNAHLVLVGTKWVTQAELEKTRET